MLHDIGFLHGTGNRSKNRGVDLSAYDWEDDPVALAERTDIDVVVELMGGSELLSSTPWLQSSIEVRNPYIGPLNLIQIELLRRKRQAQNESEPESESLRDLLRLTVQGIAAGMRTTG